MRSSCRRITNTYSKSVLGQYIKLPSARVLIYKAAVLIIKTLKKGGDMIANNEPL